MKCAVLTERRWWLWTLAICLVGAALRLAAIGDKTLWLDEAFSLWMARHDLPALFAWLVYIDHHPPLYYILLHEWVTLFGYTPSALRSLSAVTSILALPVYALAARKLAGDRLALVAAWLLAISPFHIRYAQETRMYGVLTLTVALLFWALAHVLTDRARSWRAWPWILLAVAEAAAMLTHNTATILVPVALNGAIAGLWLAHRYGYRVDEFPAVEETGFFRRWVWSQIAALLLWSPWALPFVRQAQVVDGDFWIAPPDLWTVWLALGSLSYAYLPDWLPSRDYLAWLALLVALWGVWQWRRSLGVTWLLVALWLIPPAVELLASLRRPIFYDRTLIWTALPYYLLLARGIIMPQQRTERWRMGWGIVSFTAIAALCGLGLWNYYAAFEKENWNLAAAHVATNAQPNELILFHASWTELPFNYYYPDEAPLLVQHGVPADLFNAGVLEPPMTEADVPRVLDLLEGQERVWLVYSHWWYTDPDGLLLRVLEEQLDIVDAQEWPGIQVLLYQRN
jgi:uncharacterized membrane protein